MKDEELEKLLGKVKSEGFCNKIIVTFYSL